MIDLSHRESVETCNRVASEANVSLRRICRLARQGMEMEKPVQCLHTAIEVRDANGLLQLLDAEQSQSLRGFSKIDGSLSNRRMRGKSFGGASRAA